MLVSGDLMNEDAVLAWILNQQKEETIENVNLEILDKILEDEEYVAVFFCMCCWSWAPHFPLSLFRQFCMNFYRYRFCQMQKL